MSSEINKKNQLELGQRIKMARNDAGLTQGDLAREAGTTVQSWGKYEDGSVPPRVNMLAPFLRRGYSLDWIMTGHGSMIDKNRATELEGRADQCVQDKIPVTIQSGRPGAKKPRSGKSEAPPSHAEAANEGINVHRGMMIASKVLSSNTGYAKALWENLKSFEAAVDKEERVEELTKEVRKLTEMMERMEARLAEKDAVPEKKSLTS